jgi:hypothetical protein
VIDRLLVESRRASFVVTVLAIFVAKVGVTPIPNFDVAIVGLTGNPLVAPLGGDPGASYLMSNWLGPAVLHVLGVMSERALFVVYAGLSLVFVLLVARLLWRSMDERCARRALVVFLALPVAAVPFFWVGYDSLTLVLLVGILLAARSDAVVVALGVLGGMQHAEIVVVCALLGLVYLSLVRAEERPAGIGRRTMVVAILGAVVGRAALEVLFRARGIEVSSRAQEAFDNLSAAPAQFVGAFVLVVLSGVGVGWVVLMLGWRTHVVGVVASGVPLVLALGVSVISLDQTRVFALVSLYVVLMSVAMSARCMSRVSVRMVGVVVALFLLYPGIWVWEGEVSWYANWRGVTQVLELLG